MNDSTYNGWTNYETWNAALWLGNDEGLYSIAALWLGNDEGLYSIAREFDFYSDLIPTLIEVCGIRTPDGVRWQDDTIDHSEMDEMLAEL